MMDLKQTIAVVLMLGMLAMLLNMMSNGPFFDADQPPSEENGSTVSEYQRYLGSAYRNNVTLQEIWGSPGPVLNPCWETHLKYLKGKTWGFIGARLSNGPHYHRMQISDAVVVSKYLGATLLVPNIKDGQKEPNGQFDKIYDTNHFITSLQNIVRVVGRIPDDMNSVIPTVISIPYGVTQEYIDQHIRPIFNTKVFITIDNFFFDTNMKEETANKEFQALRCLVMYKALQFHFQLLKLAKRIITRMREAAEISDGHFVAVDIPVDLLQRKGCSNTNSSYDKFMNRKCATPLEIGIFLSHLGFPTNTAIYLTQSRWHEELNPLKEMFPNLHTKEYSMPFNEEKQILYSGKTQFEKALDFYVCTQSDIFVPSISGTFYSTVSGVRIALGKTQILVPNSKLDLSSEKKLRKSLSRYVTKKDHTAYSCFC